MFTWYECICSVLSFRLRNPRSVQSQKRTTVKMFFDRGLFSVFERVTSEVSPSYIVPLYCYVYFECCVCIYFLFLLTFVNVFWFFASRFESRKENVGGVKEKSNQSQYYEIVYKSWTCLKPICLRMCSNLASAFLRWDDPGIFVVHGSASYYY